MQQIQWLPEIKLAQVVKTKIQMCLLDDKFQGLCVPVECRDFLGDIFYGETHRVNTDMYGFKWAHGVQKLGVPFHVGIRVKGKTLDSKAARHMQRLFDPFTKPLDSIKVHSDQTSLAITAGPKWSKGPWSVGLLTLLARQGVYYHNPSVAEMDPLNYLKWIAENDNPLCYGDKTWIVNTLEPLQQLIEGDIPEKFKKLTFESYDKVKEAHHSGGFYAAWTGRSTS